MQDLVHRHRRERLIAVKASAAEERAHRNAGRPTLTPDPPREHVLTALVVFTAAFGGVYFLIETYLSAVGSGLVRFGYLVDLFGIVLLMSGAVAGWRGRTSARATLTAGWAWTAANFWRATMDRYASVAEGPSPYPASLGLWLGPLLTAVAIVVMAAAVWVTARHARA
jgi:hypothetical protein